MAENHITSTSSNYQRQTILNLYNSGIPEEIISLQLDINQEEVSKVIENARKEEERKMVSIKQASDTPSLGSFYIDAVIDLYLPCVNAVYCARSMIKVMRQGINPILNQYDYPEMSVHVGIDVGENTVVQLGWDTHTNIVKNEKNIDNKRVLIKKPY